MSIPRPSWPGCCATKEVSASEIAASSLERIAAVDGQVDAYLTVTDEVARATAKRVDEKIAAGEEIAPLAGIPIAIKDNICTKGIQHHLRVPDAGELCPAL